MSNNKHTASKEIKIQIYNYTSVHGKKPNKIILGRQNLEALKAEAETVCCNLGQFPLPHMFMGIEIIPADKDWYLAVAIAEEAKNPLIP